jgi:hypothetical protein
MVVDGNVNLFLHDSGTQLLEVYALEIQMYTAQKNNKAGFFKILVLL